METRTLDLALLEKALGEKDDDKAIVPHVRRRSSANQLLALGPKAITNSWNVCDFGAKGDGLTLDTRRFRRQSILATLLEADLYTSQPEVPFSSAQSI